MTQTLFDKYGGFKTFQQITRIFYAKLLDSPNIAPFFAGKDIDALINHQANFLSHSLGGPSNYDKQVDLFRVHSNLRILDEHYDEVVDLLEESLEDAEVENQDIDAIIDLVNTLKDQIVTA